MNPIDFAELLTVAHPHVGLLLLRGGYLKPLAVPVEFQFTDTATDKVVQGTTTTVFDTFMWVTNMVALVERPNWMPGSVLKGQDDFYVSQDAYVDLSVEFSGPPGIANLYTIESEQTPLSLLCSIFTSPWPEGWMLWPQQAPLLRAQNRRVFQDAEIPYRVRWALFGKQIIVPAEIYRTVALE